jgi:glycine/serine hydroxymethyltransferase
MKEPEMDAIADMIDTVLERPDDEQVAREIRERTRDLCTRFPFYARVFSL